jgi:alkaline phosphatase
MDLIEDPEVVTGVQDTRSLSSLVTDSAASAAAWGSGVYQWNGQINMLPDKTVLEPIGRLMKKIGMKVGLVTTTTITHATPSGFAISIFDREWQDQIAAQHLEHGMDILMGGGNAFFAADKRKDKRDLYSEFQAKGYEVLRDRTSLEAAKGGKLLGIFNDSHLPYTVDRDNSFKIKRSTPTLAEMTKVAIEKLKGSPQGFLLQVEGGRVDHGGHANDLAAAVFDQIAFEDAVKVVMDFAREDGETLVVITSDHACGGPALNGAGNEYFDATAGLESLKDMKSSYGPILTKLGLAPTPNRVQDVVEDSLGLNLTSPEAQGIVDGLAGKSPFKLSSLHNSAGMTVAMILGNHTHVKWTSGNHTNDHVLLSAYGPGSHHFQGMTRNVDVYSILTGLRGITHKNPSMDYEKALPLMMQPAAFVNGACCADECPFAEYEARQILAESHAGHSH